MSLDLVILADDGKPVNEVRIPVDLHHKIIEKARDLGSPLILRMHDYYEDTEIAVNELKGFIAELNRLTDNCEGHLELMHLLQEMRMLALIAHDDNKPLLVLAD